MMGRWTGIAVAVGVGLIVGLLAGWRINRPGDTITKRVDTLVVWREMSDSAAILARTKAAGYEVVPAGRLDALMRRPEKVRTDTVVREAKVVVTRDSLVYVEVPMERQEWAGRADSVDYRVTTTGYHVSLDAVSFRWPERTVEVTRTRGTGRLSFGVTAGPAVVVAPGTGKVHAGAGAAVGVTWRF